MLKNTININISLRSIEYKKITYKKIIIAKM